MTGDKELLEILRGFANDEKEFHGLYWSADKLHFEHNKISNQEMKDILTLMDGEEESMTLDKQIALSWLEEKINECMTSQEIIN